MIEGKGDRPGILHVQNNIIRVGSKFVPIDSTTILNDLTPATVWTDIDLSAWVPEDTVAVSVAIFMNNNSGTDTFAHISKPTVRSDYELAVCLSRGVACGVSGEGIVGASGRAISYYCTDATITDMFLITMNGFWIPMGKGDVDL